MSPGIVFALIAASQGVFLAFLILLKRSLHKGFFLACYFAAFSLIILSWVMVWAEIKVNLYPIALHVPLQFLMGPLLFLFIRKNGKAERKFELLIPSLVAVWFLIYWLGISFGLWYIAYPEVIVPMLTILTQLSLISILVYLIRLTRHDWGGSKIPLVISLAVFLAGNILYIVLYQVEILTQTIDYVLVGFIFILFYLSGYLYLVRFRQKSNPGKVDPKAEMILEQIRDFFSTEPQYLKKGYRIEELAVQLGEPVNQVSRSIREVAHTNFKDFINQYRIEYAKRLLSNSDMKIEAITDESGFSNKVSFIENFKKMEGVRPTEYRKSLVFGKSNQLD